MLRPSTLACCMNAWTRSASHCSQARRSILCDWPGSMSTHAKGDSPKVDIHVVNGPEERQASAYSRLAATRRAAEPTCRTGQTLNHTTGVRAPVSAVSVASATSIPAAAR